MATEEEFDIVVIGGGPGGYATALYGAAAGLSVAIVERDKVGGTCLHRGCIPAKEFLETAAVRRTIGDAKEFGIDVPGVSVDFSRSQDRKNGVVDKLFKGLSGLLKGRKVTILHGDGDAEGRPSGRGHRRGGCRARRGGAQRRPGGGLGAADAARVRGRRPLGHDLGRVPGPQGAAGVGGGHRWRRHRLRVRVAPRRPRHQGDDRRGARHHPDRLRRRHHPPGGAVVQEARHRHRHRAPRSRATRRRRTAT